MSISASVKGSDKLGRKFVKMANSVKDFTDPFREMSPLIQQEFRANFPAKGNVLKKPWKPRKFSYPWPILRKTGKLQVGWSDSVKKKKLEIKNTTDYAQYHHFGSSRLPARVLVSDSPNIIKIIKRAIIKHIKKAFK